VYLSHFLSLPHTHTLSLSLSLSLSISRTLSLSLALSQCTPLHMPSSKTHVDVVKQHLQEVMCVHLSHFPSLSHTHTLSLSLSRALSLSLALSLSHSLSQCTLLHMPSSKTHPNVVKHLLQVVMCMCISLNFPLSHTHTLLALSCSRSLAMHTAAHAIKQNARGCSQTTSSGGDVYVYLSQFPSLPHTYSSLSLLLSLSRNAHCCTWLQVKRTCM